jgi:hypothetical protein
VTTEQEKYRKIEKLLKEFIKVNNIEEIINKLIKEGIPSLEEIKEKHTEEYPYTTHKLLEMLYKLKTVGFASFM